jgi:hypothetical protein
VIIVLTANPTPIDPARYTVIDGHREEHAPGTGAPQFQVITRPERREEDQRAA